ncbi:MAG: AsmA family protein, partial [Pseudomonadota bacterium]
MRTALKLFAALIGIVVIAIVAIIVLVPTERIAQIAADQVKAATGRELTLAGGVSPSFYPVIGVETGAVTLSNAEWASTENMVSASSAKVGVELIPLISGEIKVSEVRLIDPVIALEVDENGTPNWEFGQAQRGETTTAQEGEGFVKSVSLGEAVIENGAVSFIDRSTGQEIAVEAINATIALEALDAPLSIDGDAVWNGERAEIALVLTTPAAAMAGEAIAFDVALSSAMAEVSARGEATPPAAGAQPVLNAEFAAKAASPAAALEWATGQAAPPALTEISALDVSGRAEMNASGAAVDVNGSAARGG